MVVSVDTNGLLDGPFTRLMKRMYIDTSSRLLPYDLHYPIEMEDYIRLVWDCFNSDYKLHDLNCKFQSYTLDVYDDRCLCAFSGGKDLLANVLMLKSLGYRPILFFVKGINYKYTSEYATAKRLSAILDLPFVEYKMIVRGKNEYAENPIKNQLIFAIMLDYGLKKGITHYSFGTYLDSPTDELSFEYMLSDSSQMFDTFMTFVNQIYPEVDAPMFLNDCCEAYKIIIDTDKSLLKYTNSCMSPIRYVNGYVSRAKKTYGIDLLPNRCPSCYKCCTEAIILNEFGVTNYPEVYINHCKDVIKKFYSKYKSEEYLQSMDSDDFEWVIQKYLETSTQSTS